MCVPTNVISKITLFLILVLPSVFSGCVPSGPTSYKANIPDIKIPMPDIRINTNSKVDSDTGIEKRKPAAGKANLQGKVLYNELPAANIEVKLCQEFSTIMGLECGGKIFTAKTDATGEYLIADIPPMVYEGLAARVFNTKAFIYLESGIMNSAKYELEADKTFFVPTTNLFKSDLKITSPKNHSTVDTGAVEVKWNAYPDAAYYTCTLEPEDYSAATAGYRDVRTNETRFKPEKPLPTDTYKVIVTAFNTNGVKLAQSDGEYGFYAKGNTTP